ncbi:MAG: cyclic nucleotide-binding domain-containing protein [Nitrospinaceae bacterium]
MEFEKALKCFEDIPFFDNFNREEKRFLASMDCNMVHFKNAETILREGGVDDSFYILLKGTVNVTRSNYNEDGTRRSRRKTPTVKLSKLKPGILFGQLSFIENRPRLTTITAEGSVSVLKMGGKALEPLNPRLLNKIKNRIIELLLKRLDDMNEQLLKVVR